MTIGESEAGWDGRSRAATLFGPGTGLRSQEPPPRWSPVRDVTPFAGEADGEGDLGLLRYWQIVARWRWLIAGTTAVAMVFGVIVTLLMSPIYRATTTIEIDREAPKVVDNGSVQPTQVFDNEQFYQTQYGLLKSHSLAERVVASLNLADDPAFQEQTARQGEARTTDRAARERAAADAVLRGLTVTPVRTSQLVQVSYESPNPALAAKVANAVSDNFITANLERRFQASAYARRFLEDRINAIRQKLETSERALVAYAADHQIIDLSGSALVRSASGDGPSAPTQQSIPATDLVAMDTALQAARNDRIQAEQRWRQAQATTGIGLPDILQSPTIQALQQSKAALQADYQDKLSIYKPDFPAMVQLRARLAEIDREITSNVAAIKAAVRSQYQIAVRQEASLAGQVNQLKGAVLDLNNRSIGYNIIQREVDTDRTLYDGLLQRYKEVGVAGAVGANNISIVDRAKVPTSPFQPRPLFNVGIAGLIGLMLGALLAFVIEQVDETIKTPEDIETKLGLPLLGAAPALGKAQLPAAALANPRSALSEAYHSLRTALQFSTAEGAPRSLLVTSSGPGEGKSTTSMALAQGFARLGLRVLLIDADLRNPSLHREFGGNRAEGLSNLLTGGGELAKMAQPTGHPHLYLLTSGPSPPNPSELLAGPRLAQLLGEATRDYDLVVIDGPPIMGLADALLLANVADATALMIEAGATRRGLIRSAIRRLHGGGARIVGGVLTKFDVSKATNSYGYGTGYGYAYAYSYDYGGPPKPRLDWSKPGRWFQRSR